MAQLAMQLPLPTWPSTDSRGRRSTRFTRSSTHTGSPYCSLQAGVAGSKLGLALLKWQRQGSPHCSLQKQAQAANRD